MSKRILLADDSPVIQTLAKKILEGQGYELTGVKKGGKVLQLLAEKKYDLVILDILLPDADGMELARSIRNSGNPAIKAIPIIGISGNYRNYTDSDFHDAGMNIFLLKPLNYDDLLAKIKSLTDS